MHISALALHAAPFLTDEPGISIPVWVKREPLGGGDPGPGARGAEKD